MRPILRKPFAIIFTVAALGASARAAVPELEQRVAAQRAVEQVYWNHRIWPEANAGSKPGLDAVLSDAALRAKVEDALRQSEAVGALWNRPITNAQLQAELNRMVAQTRNGAMLRELFDTLGDDPALIAETLARPVLVRRLMRDWYASDSRFHGELRARAEAAVAACRAASCMSAMGGEYRETSWRLRDDHPFVATADDPAIPLDAGDWAALRKRLSALRSGALEESAEAFTVTAVIAQSDSRLKVATTTWTKRPFDLWWAEQRSAFAPVIPATAGSFTLAAPQSTSCADDTWTAMLPEIPEPRSSHTAVWTGSEMIVWGGYTLADQNTGGRYDPATDTWTMTSTAGAPVARRMHTAVWTGTTMIVWGGENGSTPLGTGGRYDPATDTWLPTSNGANVPSARYLHTAVWTGTEMIVWGGADAVGNLNTGARYNPGTDSWTATGTGANVPAVRNAHSAVWTGTQMIVWGGLNTGFLNTGGRYTPGTDAWTATSVGAGVPAGRIQHTAVWTGTVMIVWGGQPGPVNTGGRYNPATNAWTATSIGANLPAAREQHTAIWTGTEMIVWGGSPGSGPNFNTGGRYNPTTNAWTATSTGANVPVGRSVHTAVWTGTEMIVWGGAGSGLSYTGGRYNPATNSWVATSTGTALPTARFAHTSIWTGAEMIVWGGRGDGPPLDTGAAYDPATAAWSAITESGAPTGRQNHTAVWTGTKMIVWGGSNADNSVFHNTGGAYDPAANAWTPTSVALNAPSPRYFHTAVWTGSEMIVWGGQDTSGQFNTGGRYAPATDTWTPTSTGTNVPTARATHIAAWTGSAMVVWGSNQYLNTGGRYYPATDSWLGTSVGANVPAIGTSFSSAVWTGSRVVIWGGVTFVSAVNSGVLYDPVADTWTPTSTGANCPSARYGHFAVWTGKQMIIWGSATDNSGGRYDPSTDSWTATSTGAGCPSRRYSTSGVWTGTEIIVWGGSPTTASGGRYCVCAFVAPAGAATLAVEKPAAGTARVSFTYGGSDAAAFDVVRGDLGALSSSHGDFSAATSDCLANDVSSPTDDTDVPAPGAGVWYLLRPVNCGGNGSYGSSSRDTGIAGSGHQCN